MLTEGDDRRKVDREELAGLKRQMTALTTTKNAAETRVMDLEATGRRLQVTLLVLGPVYCLAIYINSLVVTLYITHTPAHSDNRIIAPR